MVKQFRQLHAGNELLILPNAWNAKSASIFQSKKFPAIATSSSAVANSLGYEDGEQMPFEDYLFIIKRILAVITVPLTVDIEMGYGADNKAIYQHIRELARLGVAGINIEDSIIPAGTRILNSANLFANTISHLRGKLLEDGLDIFINVRCDTYILNVANKQEETNNRLPLYAAAGADGIFLPCITSPADITAAVQAVSLPLNVMCIPGLPGFAELKSLNVKRVSMGPFLFSKVHKQIESYLDQIAADQNFTAILT